MSLNLDSIYIFKKSKLLKLIDLFVSSKMINENLNDSHLKLKIKAKHDMLLYVDLNCACKTSKWDIYKI